MESQLETSKNQLIESKNENEKKMKDIDDNILRILSNTKTNLIED